MFAVPDLTVPAPVAPLHQLPPATLVRAVAADLESWRHLLRYEPDAPSRVSLPVDHPGVELWLTGWLPGQAADMALADHAHGAFAVVSGEITEHSASGLRTLCAGQTRVFGPGYQHRLANLGDQAVITVHAAVRQPV